MGFYILAVVLIRNLISHHRRTMSPYVLFSYVARPPTSLVDWSHSCHTVDIHAQIGFVSDCAV